MPLMLNFPPPQEGIHHQEQNVKAFLWDKELGSGTLYITESLFCFMTSKDEGFSLDYQSIFIHAVSRDTSTFPHECILLMVDGNLNLDEAGENTESVLVKNLQALRMEEEEDDGDYEEPSPIQLRFVPENKVMLDVMFRALVDCQALNPNPEDASDGEADFPQFDIQNGVVEEDDDGEDDDENEDHDMNEDQFEDAED